MAYSRTGPSWPECFEGAEFVGYVWSEGNVGERAGGPIPYRPARKVSLLQAACTGVCGVVATAFLQEAEIRLA